MPVKAEKVLEASKQTTTITTYTTGAPVAPSVGEIAVYVDLAAADQHRLLEIEARLKDIADTMRESEYKKPVLAARYWRLPLEDAKSAITYTLIGSEIVEGDLAIGIASSASVGDAPAIKGSIILDTCIRETVDHMRENKRLSI